MNKMDGLFHKKRGLPLMNKMDGLFSKKEKADIEDLDVPETKKLFLEQFSSINQSINQAINQSVK